MYAFEFIHMRVKNSTSLTSKTDGITIGIALSAIVALLIWRLFYGVELTDEAQYMGQIYMLFLGGGVFETDLFLQQLGSQIFAPIFYFLITVFPDDPPLFLFGRMLFFLMSLITSIVIWRLCRRWLSISSSAIVASLWLAYVPFSIPSVSYNTVGMNCWMISLCMLVGYSLDKDYRLQSLLVIAFASVLGIVAYPPLIAPIGLAIILAIYFRWKLYGRKSGNMAFMLLASSITMTMALAWLFLWKRLDAFSESIEFTSGFAHVTASSKIPLLIKQFVSLTSSGAFSVTLIVSLVGLLVFLRRWPRVWIVVVSLAILGQLTMLASIDFRVPFGYLLGLIVFVVSIVVTGAENKIIKPLVMQLIVPALMGGFVYTWFSSNGIANASLGLYPAFIGSSIIFLERLNRPELNSIWMRRMGAAVLILVSFVLTNNYYGFVYRDHAVSELDARMESGPYFGLNTTRSRQKLLYRLRSTLIEAESEYKSILCGAALPYCYLLSKLKPMSRMLYLHGEEKPMVQKYVIDQYGLGKVIEPDVIVYYEQERRKGGVVDSALETEGYHLFRRIDVLGAERGPIIVMVKR